MDATGLSIDGPDPGATLGGPDPAILDRILEAIRRHRSFLVSSHDSLDGDAIGSALGMRALLLQLGKTVTVVNPSAVPPAYRFLPHADQALAWPEASDSPFDAFVALDAGQRDRLHPVETLAREGTPFLNIDHHDGNDGYGTVNWCDPAYGSTGEMVYDLARHAGASLDLDLAEPLYVAVLTDTGRFCFANTRPSAHRMAARLLESGVDPARVHRHLYRQKDGLRLRVEGRAIERLRTAASGRIAWTSLDPETVGPEGTPLLESSDLVEIPSSLRGIEVALLFREMADGSGTRVSLRSAGSFRVNRFAERYGGGGHRRAAGLRLSLPLGRAEERIVRDLTSALESGAGGGSP